MSKGMYRREGELREVSAESLGLGEIVPFSVQTVISHLKLYEPSIYEELQKRLNEYQEQSFQKSLKIIYEDIKTWKCPNCGNENAVSEEKLEEIIRRISRVEPKVENLRQEKSEGYQIQEIADYVWKDEVSEDYFCGNCWEGFIISLHLPFSPLFPPDNPKVKPWWMIRATGVLKGESEALEKPHEANTELLQRIIKKYRGKIDDLSQKKLTICINELMIREKIKM